MPRQDISYSRSLKGGVSLDITYIYTPALANGYHAIISNRKLERGLAGFSPTVRSPTLCSQSCTLSCPRPSCRVRSDGHQVLKALTRATVSRVDSAAHLCDLYPLLQSRYAALGKFLPTVLAHPQGTPAAAEVLPFIINVAYRALDRRMLVPTEQQLGVAAVAFELSQGERSSVRKARRLEVVSPLTAFPIMVRCRRL